MQMDLPAKFITTVHDVYGAQGKIWLQNLPQLLEQLAAQWQFQFLQPMPDLSYHFVGLVKIHTTKQFAIIKIAPTAGDLTNEIKWLTLFENRAPKIYAHDEKFNTFLMEYLNPGKPLKTLVATGQDDKATSIICQIIRDLQSQSVCDLNFQSLAELPKALSVLKNRFDAKLLAQAESWFQELTSDQTQHVLIHGDLHHDNILSTVDSWKIIDPHGYIGDPVAEVGVMIRNPLACFPKERSLTATVERRLRIMADELPFDIQRIRAWAFCMTVLSIAWTLEGHHHIPEFETEIALAIDRIKT